MKINIWLLFSLYSIQVYSKGFTPDLDPNKLTFCHITINSDEEKKTFERKLKNQSSEEQFQFIELTTLGDKNDWFENACKANIKCDILNVSGHFGGNFFGESGFSLSSDELENATCSQACNGILNNPIEVYLWGCNTLAGKKEDFRSPEEYRQVLINDGYSQQEADRITSLRYSPMGTSFKDQMQRAFRGVPHLYGFKSIAPAGKNVAHMIENYLDKKGDYAGYLALERSKQLLQYLEHLDYKLEDPLNKFKGNQELYEALKVTHFTQTVTQTPKCGDHLINEQGDIERINCLLRSSDKSYLERLEAAQEALGGDNPLLFISSAYEVINSLPKGILTKEEKEALERIKTDNNSKDKILGSLKALKRFPQSYLKINSLAVKLEWLGEEKVLENYRGLILPMLKPPVSIENKDLICSLNIDAPNLVTFDDLHEDTFRSEIAIQAISCLSPSDKRIESKLYNMLLSSTGGTKVNIINALSALKSKSEEVHLAVAKELSNDEPYVRDRAARAFGSFRLKSEKITLLLANSLKDSSLSVRMSAAQSLGELKVQNKSIIKALAELLISDESTILKQLIANTLTEIKTLDKDVQLILLEAMRSESEEVRPTIAGALIASNPKNKKTLKRVLSLLDDKNTSVRQAVAFQLGNLTSKDKIIQNALLKAMKDESMAIRQSSAGALSSINPLNQQVLLRLLKLLKAEEDLNVRQIISSIIANNQLSLIGENAQLSLVSQLGDEDEYVRHNLTSSFKGNGHLSDQVQNTLVKYLKSSNPGMRESIARVFSELKNINDASQDALIRALIDSESNTKILILHALSNLEKPKKEAIDEIFKFLHDKDEYIQINSLLALGNKNIKRTGLELQLTQYLNNKNYKVKMAAGLALSKRSPLEEGTKLTLKHHLKSDDKYTKLAAAIALIKMSPKDVALNKLLLNTLKATTDRVEKSMLVYVYSEIGVTSEDIQLQIVSELINITKDWEIQESIETIQKLKPCSEKVLKSFKDKFTNFKEAWSCK